MRIFTIISVYNHHKQTNLNANKYNQTHAKKKYI
jgi:hypothetical protein